MLDNFKEILELYKEGKLDGAFYTVDGEKLLPKHFKGPYGVDEVFKYRPLLFCRSVYSKYGCCKSELSFDDSCMARIDEFIPTPIFERYYNNKVRENPTNLEKNRYYITEHFDEIAKACLSGRLKGTFLLKRNHVEIHSSNLKESSLEFGYYTFNGYEYAIWDDKGRNVPDCIGAYSAGNHVLDFILEY